MNKSIILTTQQSCCAAQLDRIHSLCQARKTTGQRQYKIALIIEYFTPTLSLFWIMPSEQTETFPWSWKLMLRTSVCRFRQNCLCVFHVRSQSQPDANQEQCSVMQNGCDGVVLGRRGKAQLLQTDGQGAAPAQIVMHFTVCDRPN